MTAPVPRVDVAPALPDPPPLVVAHGGAAGVDGAAAPLDAGAPATSRWAWLVLITVLVLAAAGTCALLLIQWTSPGSGTVAR